MFQLPVASFNLENIYSRNQSYGLQIVTESPARSLSGERNHWAHEVLDPKKCLNTLGAVYNFRKHLHLVCLRQQSQVYAIAGPDRFPQWFI